jgi:spore maturation protein CgeB
VRVLLVGAGAAFSTRDVEDGYRAALREVLGDDLYFYDLGSRLSLAQKWLNMLWRARGKDPAQRPGWPDAIYRGGVEALEMALRFRVDWVFAISGMFFHPDVLIMLRDAGKRTAVLFTESPYEDEQQARMASLVDMCWTTERTSVERLAQANPNVRYIRHAYDPARHRPDLPLDLSLPAHDVVFVGSGFPERIELLKSVDWSGIDLGLYGEWGLLGSRAKLREYVRAGAVTNETTTGLYRRARIGLNLHRSSMAYGRHAPRVAHAESLNPRAYELAACGLFQVTDPRAEVAETFGDAVPTFAPGELEQLLRKYLQDSPARRYSARRARQAILPHTFAARAATVLADLEAFEDGPFLQPSEMLAYASLKGA